MANKNIRAVRRIMIPVVFLMSFTVACNRNKSRDPVPTMSLTHDMSKMDKKDMNEMEMESQSKSDTIGMNSYDELDFTLKPTNEYVRTTTDLTVISRKAEAVEVEALGSVTYDTRQVGTISARISGRIQRLYVRYRYQKVAAGQKIMDIYSPEILTNEQNLLFLIKNDPSNLVMINATKDKLLLLGMSREQLDEVIGSRKASFTISVYSRYSGHIHEAETNGVMPSQQDGMKDISLLTEELNLKEGMYVEKGQSVFSVYNPNRAWVLLNFYADKQGVVQKGNYVSIIPETAPSKKFAGRIDFIEPFFRKENKTVSARVYFNNSMLHIPVGSQVSATIYGDNVEAYWLPSTAVLSLGIKKIAFIKEGEGFRAHSVVTGIHDDDRIEIIRGLSLKDSVVANAQYLMDSEGFIKVKE